MTENEKVIIEAIKNNKDFNYLIDQSVNNITITADAQATSYKGLKTSYQLYPDEAIQFLLNLISGACHTFPIRWIERPVNQEYIDKEVQAAINGYLLIVCLDMIITKYKTKFITGASTYTTANTWHDSWSDIEDTVFHLDSTARSLKINISSIKSTSLFKYSSDFMNKNFRVNIFDGATDAMLCSGESSLKNITKTIEVMISTNAL